MLVFKVCRIIDDEYFSAIVASPVWLRYEIDKVTIPHDGTPIMTFPNIAIATHFGENFVYNRTWAVLACEASLSDLENIIAPSALLNSIDDIVRFWKYSKKKLRVRAQDGFEHTLLCEWVRPLEEVHRWKND